VNYYYDVYITALPDYYAFGSLMPGRNASSGDYRYGFNGKEKDDEVKGNGNSYDYGFRIYDSRLGKFLSVDPLSQNFPWWTPYQFAGNTPIQAIDLDGLEILDYRSQYQLTIVSEPTLNYPDGDYVFKVAQERGRGAHVGTLYTSVQKAAQQSNMNSVMAYWTGNSLNSEIPTKITNEEANNSIVGNNSSTGAPARGARGEVYKSNKYDHLNGQNRANGGAVGGGLLMLTKNAYKATLPNTLAFKDEQQEKNAFRLASKAVDFNAVYVISMGENYKIDNADAVAKYRQDVINYMVDGTLPNLESNVAAKTGGASTYNTLIQTVGDAVLDNRGLNLKQSKNDTFWNNMKEGYFNIFK
tara:strand:- start:568 stop:1635 length:1068 start_codon:yes stop_codon:yes gene_type:complete